MQRLKVSVLVTLYRHAGAGGHVKCWERFARAATRVPDLDLTVHFLGDDEQVVPLSENVRYRLHRPRRSTRSFEFLSQMPDHTDIAGYHPSLAAALKDSDIIHSTDAFFSFAGTALKVSSLRRIPLINSVHTDTPSYTRIYMAQAVERICGRGRLQRVLLDRFKVHLHAEQRMQRMLEHHQRRSAFVMVGKPEEYDALCRTRPAREVGLLRRGVDAQLFHPVRRDRGWLQQRFGIPPERVVVLFVGRLSEGKNLSVLVDALAMLDGVHLICAGDGPLRQEVIACLGPRASCPGVLAEDELARVYASADLLAAPSEIEVFSNVLQEALASGLPALVAKRGGMGRLIVPDVTGLVVEGSARSWTSALESICRQPERRIDMRRAARELAEEELPSWDDVLHEDLVSRWRRASAR